MCLYVRSPAARGIRFACARNRLSISIVKGTWEESRLMRVRIYTRIRESARARANMFRTYLARLNQWRIRPEMGQCTKIHERARSGRIMSPGHRNRINCIDRHPRAPVHKRSRLRRGWEFAADKLDDGKFPIFVSRSRLTGPHFELMATVSSAAAAEQMARAKYIQNRL